MARAASLAWPLAVVAATATCLTVSIKDGDSFPCSMTGACPSPYRCYAGQCRRQAPISDGGPEVGDGARAGDAADAAAGADRSDAVADAAADAAADTVTDAGASDRPDVPKKASGQLCASSTECASGNCGGRCCNQDAACTCPQPGPHNLLLNPGFDGDLGGWTVTSGEGIAIWASQDAVGCPFSGSGYMTLTGTNSPRISQCVPVSPSTNYNFGAQMRSGSGGTVHCTAEVYSGPGCTAGSTMVGDLVWLNVDWSGDQTMPFQTFSNVVSARVSCYVESADAMYFDMAYLTPAPDGY